MTHSVYGITVFLNVLVLHDSVTRVSAGVGNLYERVHSHWLRSWAASECLEHVKADDEFTHCISIGPVSLWQPN